MSGDISTNPQVEAAIEELHVLHPVEVQKQANGNGGAYVRVEGMSLDPEGPFLQKETWFWFEIPQDYPFADIYPHYCAVDLQLKDGRSLQTLALPESLQIRNDVNPLLTNPSFMISRRTRYPGKKICAQTKLLRIVRWLEDTTAKMYKIAP